MKQKFLIVLGGWVVSGMSALAAGFESNVPEGDFRITPPHEQEYFQPVGNPPNDGQWLRREQPTPAGDPKRGPHFSSRAKLTKTIFLPSVD